MFCVKYAVVEALSVFDASQCWIRSSMFITLIVSLRFECIECVNFLDVLFPFRKLFSVRVGASLEVCVCSV